MRKVKKALMSNQIFAKILETVGVEPPMKTSLRTGKETYAFAKTDKEFTALLDHPNPKVQTLVAARLGTKSTIEETRTENLMKVADRGHYLLCSTIMAHIQVDSVVVIS